MRILLIEDEKDLAKGIKKGLERKGYEVFCAFDGREALDMFFDRDYHLIILDLNLPFIGGIDLLKTFRAESDEVKILILSAKSDTNQKVEGLNLGANDFLSKPFDFSELVARISALTRRNFHLVKNIIETDSLTIDLNSKEVFAHGVKVSLSKIEFAILEHLALNASRVVPSEEIVEKVWQDGETNSLKVHINQLRKKLASENNNATITTHRGVGYCLETKKGEDK